MSLTHEDISDIKIVLKEQLDSLNRLSKIPLPHPFEHYKTMRMIYQDILECNKVMMEIINGPSGGIEKMIERNA
jgi:hypothetical protein